MIGSLRGEAYKAGISELDLLGIDHPNTTYFKITLFLTAVSLVARYYLLFTKHPQFRKLVSILLLIDWPVAMCLALALGVVGIVGPLITTGLISWGISCAVWVTYMQKSKRVRVTFENCIEEVELNTANIVVPAPKMVNVYPVNSPRAIPSPASAPTSTVNQSPPQNQPIQSNIAARAVTVSSAPDDLWAQALAEYDSGSRNQGLWARLFSDAQGNEAAVKANYMRIRVDEMQQVIAIEKAKQSVDISHEQHETIDNSIPEKQVEVKIDSNLGESLPFLVMKWLPWLGVVLAILGILFFLGKNSSETNQSARADIPVLNPAPPTAPVPNLNQATNLGAKSEEMQREAHADAKATSMEIPKFINFPVQTYSGTYAKVELTKQDSAFRTRLLDSFQSPINFAGEYTLTLWGCGMDCIMGAAVSKRTGMVVWLPGTVCCWKGSGKNIEYRSNSKLIVLGGLINEEGKHAAHFYELKNDVFVPILSTPVTEVENK